MDRNSVSHRAVSYSDVGEGPAVLLIHAFGLDRTMWKPQVEALTAAGYRALVPDMRGFGTSGKPEVDFTFETLVSDMVDLLDDARVDSAVAVGVSMGAATSVALAVGHPERVRGLLLADNSRPDGALRGEAAAARIRQLGLEGLADVYEPILFGESFRLEHADFIAAWRKRLTNLDAEDLATMVGPYHSRPDPGPHLPRIAVPTSLVFGAEDAAVPESRRDDYLPIPGSTKHVIPGAGHISNLEKPEDFNELLIDLTSRAYSRLGSNE